MDNGKRCSQADVEVLVLEAMATLDERLDVLETKVDIFDRRLSEAEVSLAQLVSVVEQKRAGD